MKRRLALAVGVATLLNAMLLPYGAAAQPPERFGHVDIGGRTISLDRLPSQQDANRIVVVAVELEGRPVTAVTGDALSSGKAFNEVQKAGVRRELALRQRAIGPRLRALGASIESTFTDVFNGFRIRVKAGKLRQIASLAGVTHIYSVPTHQMDNANTVGYLGADKTWGDTGFTGAGVKIAIIDSGINYDHLDFNGAGSAAWDANNGLIIEPGTFPTSKVVAGYDLVGDDYDGSNTPHPDPDPLDCKAVDAGTVQHGTHVAGTAAGVGVLSNGQPFSGPYNGSTLGTKSFRVAPGVAPKAKLMAYRVFGCAGSTRVVVDAIERAVRDGADIINMSLGSAFGNPGSIDVIASNNASLAGVTVVASAGNEGPSAYATGSPAVATRAISVAAMDAQSGFPGATVDLATQPDVSAIDANNGPLPVSGVLNVFRDDPSTPTDPDTGSGGEDLGCDAAAYAYNAFTAGQIAVVTRGGCARIQKPQEGQRQGAAAVVMINNVSGLPPYEHTISGVTIPFLGVSNDAAGSFDVDDGTSATITPAGTISNPTFKQSADFTSGGPRRTDLMIKPDVAAPGVSVFSADGSTVDQGKSLSGTSMAAPAVAGVAALVKQAHPGWLPRDIKAAIVGTASPGKLDPYDLRLAGAGLATPRRAVDTRAFVYTVPGASSLTFGYHELFDQPGTSVAYRETRTFTIRNTGTSQIKYNLSNTFNTDAMDLGVSISPSSITVPAQSSRDVEVTLTMTEAKAAALPDVAAFHGPDLAIDGSGQIYAPLLYVAGAITATPTATPAGVYALRVPWLVAPRGTSGIKDAPGTRTPYQKVGDLRKSSIQIRNAGIHAGIADVYQWGLVDANDGLDGIDLRAAGVQSLDPDICSVGAPANDRCLIFAINTWGRWGNAGENEFDVLIDTNNDRAADYLVAGVDLGLVLGTMTGVEGSVIIDLHTNSIVDLFFATAPTDGSTLLLPVLASEIGLRPNGDHNFDYWVESWDVYDDILQFDEMGTPSGGSTGARFNAFNPVFSNANFVALDPGGRTTLPLVVDASRYNPNRGMLGWLVVSLEDANGEFQADGVPVGALP